GRRVAKLADVDRGLGLAADRHERGRGTDRDHAAADDLSGSEPLLACRGGRLAGGEQRREIVVIRVRHGSLIGRFGGGRHSARTPTFAGASFLDWARDWLLAPASSSE